MTAEQQKWDDYYNATPTRRRRFYLSDLLIVLAVLGTLMLANGLIGDVR